MVPANQAASVSLPVPPGTDLATAAIQIPPEAVVYTGNDPFSLEEFDTSLGSGLVQKVTIHDLLDAYNDKLKLPLQYAEVTVHYTVGEGAEAIETTAGPYRLAPRGADGSSATVPFIRPKSGRFTFYVAGTACCDEKCRSPLPLRSEPISDLTINITELMIATPDK